MRGIAVAAPVLVALVLAGCGGERQDESEPRGEFTLEVLEASFPERQSLSQPARLAIEVRNTDDRDLPGVAVTVRTRPEGGGEATAAFAQAVDDPRLADGRQPVWIVDQAPTGSTGSAASTWSLGSMFPGQTERFEWRLTAVRAGSYRVDYSVSPGLYGRAVPADGQNTTGSFDVVISDEPVPARVNDEGEVVRGAGPGGGGSDR
jgi:hypothetical protein